MLATTKRLSEEAVSVRLHLCLLKALRLSLTEDRKRENKKRHDHQTIIFLSYRVNFRTQEEPECQLQSCKKSPGLIRREIGQNKVELCAGRLTLMGRTIGLKNEPERRFCLCTKNHLGSKTFILHQLYVNKPI